MKKVINPEKDTQKENETTPNFKQWETLWAQKLKKADNQAKKASLEIPPILLKR